jgi:hypothetical protein
VATKTYLIQSCYGYVGTFNGGNYNIVSGGLSNWKITWDGTAEGLQAAFLNAQENSETVKIVSSLLKEHGIPQHLARWLLFSVVDSSRTNTNQV